MKTTVSGFDNRYFLSINETCDLIGLSRSTIYRMEQIGKFPKRVLISTIKKGYRTSELKRWMEDRK